MYNEPIEIEEVVEAIDEILPCIEEALSHLYKAKDWGFIDFLGGGFFSSMIKRDHIKESEYYMDQINLGLEKVRKELSDLNMELTSYSQADDELWDIWLDNFVTDIRVQNQIKASIEDLEELKMNLDKIKYDLDIKRGNLDG